MLVPGIGWFAITNSYIFEVIEAVVKFASTETTDGLGTSTQTIPQGNALMSVLSNLSLTIILTVHVTFSHPINYAVKKSIV